MEHDSANSGCNIRGNHLLGDFRAFALASCVRRHPFIAEALDIECVSFRQMLPPVFLYWIYAFIKQGARLQMPCAGIFQARFREYPDFHSSRFPREPVSILKGLLTFGGNTYTQAIPVSLFVNRSGCLQAFNQFVV
jgi:hypothetical protein